MTTAVPSFPGTPFDALPAQQRRRLVLRATLRTLATVALVVAIYFLVPMDRSMDPATVAELVLGGLAFLAIVVWQVRSITRSEYPTLRAVEALGLTIPLYILLFATVYYLMNHANRTSFGLPLSRIDSMYFSATVFTTVGFGDITAKGEAARVLVTFQMMLDLVFIGLVVRLVINAIKISQQRHVAGLVATITEEPA